MLGMETYLVRPVLGKERGDTLSSLGEASGEKSGLESLSVFTSLGFVRVLVFLASLSSTK